MGQSDVKIMSVDDTPEMIS